MSRALTESPRLRGPVAQASAGTQGIRVFGPEHPLGLW